jgi:hypothetical protein
MEIVETVFTGDVTRQHAGIRRKAGGRNQRDLRAEAELAQPADHLDMGVATAEKDDWDGLCTGLSHPRLS